MDKYAGLQQRRGVQENGQPSTADFRFRAFVAVVLLASGGTVLRAYSTIQNDEALTRLQTTAPPVVRVVVLADTHGARRPVQPARVPCDAPPLIRFALTLALWAVCAVRAGHHRELDVPDGHLLVHAGDVSLVRIPTLCGVAHALYAAPEGLVAGCRPPCV
jgi:NaMN:DMB phosphoribosyltransferase